MKQEITRKLIPLFTSDGMAHGFIEEIESSGGNGFVSFRCVPDRELDHMAFEHLCTHWHDNGDFKARFAECFRELGKNGMLAEHWRYSPSKCFPSAEGVTAEGAELLVSRVLVPHWNAVADYIRKFGKGEDFYDTIQKACEAFFKTKQNSEEKNRMAHDATKKNSCLGCRYFNRDFNRYNDREGLEGMEVGYCMRHAPVPRYQDIGSGRDRNVIAVFPLVDEDACCGEFEQGGEE